MDELYAELRQCHALRSEMAHLCTNLQAYVMFEVLERAWNDFMRDLDSVSNLDSLIGATMGLFSYLFSQVVAQPRHVIPCAWSRPIGDQGSARKAESALI